MRVPKYITFNGDWSDNPLSLHGRIGCGSQYGFPSPFAMALEAPLERCCKLPITAYVEDEGRKIFKQNSSIHESDSLIKIFNVRVILAVSIHITFFCLQMQALTNFLLHPSHHYTR